MERLRYTIWPIRHREPMGIDPPPIATVANQATAMPPPRNTPADNKNPTDTAGVKDEAQYSGDRGQGDRTIESSGNCLRAQAEGTVRDHAD